MDTPCSGKHWVCLYKLREFSGCTLYGVSVNQRLPLPLMGGEVAAGFPSPADNYVELELDLNEHLISNPAATYFVRVRGNSMVDAGIYDGSLLLVDASLELKTGDIAICRLQGGFTVKRIQIDAEGISLLPANPAFKAQAIRPCEDLDFAVWGIVKAVINKLR